MTGDRAFIRHAAAGDLDAVAGLFDAYRRFYGLAADVALARAFIGDRLAQGDSAILVAEDGGELLGFAQLYPSFCSLAAGRIHILHDLFVLPEARRRGAGRAMLEAAAAFARTDGAVRLDLATARGNRAAQALYESLGWARDEDFYCYSLNLAAE